MVVVALVRAAMGEVLVGIEGAVGRQSAQRLDDLPQRVPGGGFVMAGGIGDLRMVRLLMDGAEHLVEALPALGGDGHHRRTQLLGQARAVDGFAPAL